VWNTAPMGAIIRVCVAAAAVLIGAGCETNRDFNGVGLIGAVSQEAAERELRGLLVSFYHADPDDADCLAREAVRDTWSDTDPNVNIRPDWSKAQFEGYADACDMDLDDLWFRSD
jgi:hypothetical protein